MAVSLFDQHHRNIEALSAALPYDVCIVGSGFSGIVLGTQLAKVGIRTLIIESGYAMARWIFDSEVKSLADYEVTGNANYPTKRTKARLVGGNSNFWTGRCERLHPSDFSAHPYVPVDNPWPIAYGDLEPYYERAEALLRVRGGELSGFAAPRSGPLPLGAGTDISSIQHLFASAGATVDTAPTATPRKAIRFFRVQNEILPEFLASANGTIVSGATVTRLYSNRERRIIGAEVRTLDGKQMIARARVFVISCGGIETPRLLLLSRSEQFPCGIGNSLDRVGRGFNEHPTINCYANIRHTKGTFHPRHKVGRIYQFYETARCRGLGAINLSVIQSWLLPHHLMPTTDLFKEFGRVFGRVLQPTVYIGAHIEMKPCDSNRVTLSTAREDRFGNPLAKLHLSFSEDDRCTLEHAEATTVQLFELLGAKMNRVGPMTFGRHHMGACRMGTDPRSSVVDPHLRVHATPNLYLLGSETFVTGGAVTPTLTIVALAHRLAERLCDTLSEQPDVTDAGLGN